MSGHDDALVTAIARELHQLWCSLPGHSYGDHDREDAEQYAAELRERIRKDNEATA